MDEQTAKETRNARRGETGDQTRAAKERHAAGYRRQKNAKQQGLRSNTQESERKKDPDPERVSGKRTRNKSRKRVG
jgi:hypothetical protein